MSNPNPDGVAYLLLHVGVPTHVRPVSLRHIIEANRAARAMGIRLLRIPTVAKHTPNQRYVFRFPADRADDKAAVKIAEAILYGLALSFGPFGDPLMSEVVYAFPASFLRSRAPLDLGLLAKHEEGLPHESRSFNFPEVALRSASYVSDSAIVAAWKAARVLYLNPSLAEAARFLKASQDAFFVWPGQIDEVLSNTSLTPKHAAEQTAVEDALINAFKVVEALIGDPPRDDRKFLAKLRAIGVDPNRPHGYHKPIPIYEFIREMSVARDRKSAHGSTKDRITTITNMFEYHLCARYLLVVAIETHLGEPLFRGRRTRTRRRRRAA